MRIFLEIVLSIILIGACSQSLFAYDDNMPFEVKTKSEKDGIVYYYNIKMVENKYWPWMDEDSYKQYSVFDDQKVPLFGIRVTGELGDFTLPTKLYNEEYEVTVYFKALTPIWNGKVTANKLIIPKEYRYFTQYNPSDLAYPAWELSDLSDPFAYTFSVKEFVCKNNTKEGLYSEDGVLFNGMFSETELVQLPVLADKINYHFPADVSWPISDINYTFVYNPLLEYPLIFSEETRNLDDYAFYYYPFAGIRIPEKFKNQTFPIDSSKLVTFENYKLSTRIPRTLAAVCIPKYDIDSFWKKGLFYLYSDGSVRGNLKYVEFRTDVLPTYSDPDYQYPGGFSNDIVTFVQPHLVDGFKQLQSDGLFPPNAVIEPVKDWIYLHPTLDNGKWVNRQSQFIYAACRFGNSEIVDEEWATDNDEIATVDETGIVTLVGNTGSVTITCTLTDQNGEEYTATKLLEVNPGDITSDITEMPSDEITYSSGVYNIMGIYVGDSLDNLPKGIYISNGKKIMVK